MIVWAKAREGADDHAVVETALRHHAMRLDGYVIAESRLAENASRSNGAARTDSCLAEELHAGFNDRVFPRDDIGVDQDRFRQLNCHTFVHQGVALPFAEDAVDFGKVRSGVAAENFARVRSHVGEDGLALCVQDGDGVGQIEFTMLIVGSYLSERAPQLL